MGRSTSEARQTAEHAAALHFTAEHEHDVAVAMIGTAGAVLARGATKLTHDQHDHALEGGLQIGAERRKSARQTIELTRQVAVFRAALRAVRIPAAQIEPRPRRLADSCPPKPSTSKSGSTRRRFFARGLWNAGLAGFRYLIAPGNGNTRLVQPDVRARRGARRKAIGLLNFVPLGSRCGVPAGQKSWELLTLPAFFTAERRVHELAQLVLALRGRVECSSAELWRFWPAGPVCRGRRRTRWQPPRGLR